MVKKNRIIDYIDRYFNNEIEINFKSNEDKLRIDKFVKLLDKKINNKPKKYINNMIKKLETAIKYDKNIGIIKNIEYFKISNFINNLIFLFVLNNDRL